MTEIILKEFDLNLKDKEDLLSNLEMISLIHSRFSGAVFPSPTFRMTYGQYPYEAKIITLYTDSEGKINYLELRKTIENNLCASVIIYRDTKKGNLIKTYFLPEAIENNPSRRKSICDTDIDKRLECFKYILKD